MRTHVDFFAPITKPMLNAASRHLGRRVFSDEMSALLRRDLSSVVARWTQYGEWVARVDSGAWYTEWAKRKAALSRQHAREAWT